MLGFSYIGQTYVAGMPFYQYILKIKELFYCHESTKALAHHLVSIIESADISDNVATQVLSLLKIIENFKISDVQKLNFAILVVQIAKVYENPKILLNYLIKEVISAVDLVNVTFSLVIKELARIKDLIKVNGQVIIVLWQGILNKGEQIVSACYEKGEAIVQSVYRKLRQ